MTAEWGRNFAEGRSRARGPVSGEDFDSTPAAAVKAANAATIDVFTPTSLTGTSPPYREAECTDIPDRSQDPTDEKRR